jgi:hypothetical protein
MPLFLWLLGAVTLFLPVFRHTCPSRPKVWDELNAPRDIRTLELAILSEQNRQGYPAP